ncbi:MAG: acyltransferase [Deltaproteobacteria bacterium]|nr:acyltransferase [Deltaproteobacteria bacterium]
MYGKIKAALRIPLNLYEMCISYWPGPIGERLRYAYWRKRLGYLGRNVKIDVGVHFQNPQYISIDDNAWIDKGVILMAGPDSSSRPRRYVENRNYSLDKGRIHIGKSVHIGAFSIISGIGGVCICDECGFSSGVKVFSFSNHFRSDMDPSDTSFHFGPLVEHSRQFVIEGPVVLEENVGVALDAIILPGVTIGKYSFVAINSVVTSSFEENSLIAGNPALRVTARFRERKSSENE